MLFILSLSISVVLIITKTKVLNLCVKVNLFPGLPNQCNDNRVLFQSHPGTLGNMFKVERM